MNKDSYHKSNLGSFAGGVQADIDGYVHLTLKAVLAGNWDAIGGKMTREQAKEIAEHNVAATESAEADLAEWQSR